MSSLPVASHDQPVLDVSSLPDTSFDSKAVLWWGNTLMLFIETGTVILLLTSYYYVRRNFEQWPPPKADPLPSVIAPLPWLGAATANAILLVLSCIPAFFTDTFARKQKHKPVLIGLCVMFVIGLVSLYLRWKEFPATQFSWGDNAYASIVWTMLGLHLTYILAGTLEYLIMAVWLMFHDLDTKHSLDVTLVGVYWYWVAGINAIIYFTIFLSPRVL